MTLSGQLSVELSNSNSSTRSAAGAATEKFTPRVVMLLPRGKGLPRWVLLKVAIYPAIGKFVLNLSVSLPQLTYLSPLLSL